MDDAQAEGGQQQQGYQLKEQHYYKVVTSYMPESFEQDAIQIALVAVDKFKQLKDMCVRGHAGQGMQGDMHRLVPVPPAFRGTTAGLLANETIICCSNAASLAAASIISTPAQAD